jgi:cell division protein FtsZ
MATASPAERNPLNDVRFDFAEKELFHSIIKVVGVGGGGGNAVRHMYEMGIEGIDYLILNTDNQALNDNPLPAQYKVQLGAGLGAGMNSDKGKQAAVDSKEILENLVNSDGQTKMIFITAGMGGGTGTGAAPVIAEIAKKAGLLTVAIVTAPFGYEGRKKREQALKGIEELKAHCDTVLVVLNDRLMEMYQDLDVDQAFDKADDVLANAARSIAEIITQSGKINSDFEDVKTILFEAGHAVMGYAQASGKDRAIEAVTAALNSPLLDDKDIKGASRVLATVACHPNNKLKIWEKDKIVKYIAEEIDKEEGNEAETFKLGYIIDDKLQEDEVRFTLIAADFKGTENYRQEVIERSKGVIIDTKPKSNTIASPVAPTPTDEKVEEKAKPEVVIEPVKKPSTIVQPRRENDTQRIRTMIDEFCKDRPTAARLEAPAYQRYNIDLIDLRRIPQEEWVEESLV